MGGIPPTLELLTRILAINLFQRKFTVFINIHNFNDQTVTLLFSPQQDPIPSILSTVCSVIGKEGERRGEEKGDVAE